MEQKPLHAVEDASEKLSRLQADVARLRAEGRLVLDVALDDIDTQHLTRDRAALDPEEMRVLEKSIFSNGQRTPVELAQLQDGQGKTFGLISGWRRISALSELFAKTSDPRFRTVRAIVRQPRDAEGRSGRDSAVHEPGTGRPRRRRHRHTLRCLHPGTDAL